MNYLPPGPTSISAVDLLKSIFMEPGPVVREYAAKYGDPFRTVSTGGPITVTGHPEAIPALNPPVVDTGRAAREPFKMMGYTIPAGEGMNPSPLLLHMREDL